MGYYQALLDYTINYVYNLLSRFALLPHTLDMQKTVLQKAFELQKLQLSPASNLVLVLTTASTVKHKKSARKYQ